MEVSIVEKISYYSPITITTFCIVGESYSEALKRNPRISKFVILRKCTDTLLEERYEAILNKSNKSKSKRGFDFIVQPSNDGKNSLAINRSSYYHTCTKFYDTFDDLIESEKFLSEFKEETWDSFKQRLREYGRYKEN